VPIVLEPGGAIPHKAPPLNNAQEKDFFAILKLLTYEGLWEGAGNIVEGALTRIDNQGPFMVNGSNIQGQLNGVNGNSTFSCALVVPALAPGRVPDAGNQRYVLNRVQTALADSLSQQLVYTVNGTSP